MSRVLVIGIDGTRPDALATAKTPALDALIANGAFADNTRILGTRYRKNDTVSGPGWSSFLTGVWADKHGVNDNGFKDHKLSDYPHFFARIKSQFPDAVTGSFVDWEPIDKFIVSGATTRKVYPAHGADDYAAKDAQIANDAKDFLANQDPHATMVYFGATDETGHRDGFHPSVETYVQAIEQVDQYIGSLMTTIKARPNFEKENWLVLVSTDHGGQGTGHGGGHDVPAIYTTFLVVSGKAAVKGKIGQSTYVVDLPVTALKHLGVPLDSKWNLDGVPVGLK